MHIIIARYRRLLFAMATLLLAGQVQQADASHLVGGDLGYQYLGETAPGSGLFRYKLKMRMYLNCGASSNWPQMIDWLGGETNPLRVGVYSEDPANPNAAKERYTIAYVYLNSYSIITPDIPDSCVIGDGQCVEESLFEGEVIVPASLGGYHLYFQGYSRNAAIANLVDPGNAGFGIYSFIPPTAIVNSSPSFVGVPVPFICVNEITTFSNAAEDADGDSLVFSFEMPFDSQEDIAGVVDPPLVLAWPIAPVTYLPGFGPLEPFGAGGVAIIDPETGATQFSATLIGNWAVAVEVKEYRNGQLIGRIKSDMQLLSLPCSNNDAPIPAGGSLVTSYSVNAGDTLCFPLNFVDADGDVIYLDANGTIFDGNLFSPPAAITGPLTGDSTLASAFCWPTVCEQGRSEPYTFTLVAYDQACPPGIFSTVISVDVIPAAEQLVISGPPIVCAGQSVSTYCAEAGGGTTYDWSVVGGNVTSPSNEQCVTVEWNTSGTGSVSVTSSVGDCVFSTLQPVSAVEPPQATFTVALDTTCTGIRATAVNSSSQGTSAQWVYNGQPLNAGQESVFTLPFNGNGTLQLTVTDPNGCTAQSEQTFSVAPYGDVVEFTIPNVFSPNGDGKNDFFELITSQDLQDCYRVQVFDRWGNEVFTSAGTRVRWDGTRDGGNKASDGVYYYIITVDQETFNGHVSLMR